jgi:hypothetical protein
MKKYDAEDVVRVKGSVGIFGTVDSIAVIGRALNSNADILKQLINRVEELEEEVAKLKGEENDN